MVGRRHGKFGTFAQLPVMHQQIIVLRVNGLVDFITEGKRPIVARPDLVDVFPADRAQIMHNVAAADN